MKILVVGSGASGVHFALSALEMGHAVELVDVGYLPAPPALPTAAFPALPVELADPVEYFLGAEGQHVIYPGPDAKVYGFPPGKQYVFRRPPQFSEQSDQFDPVISFARGGLAEAWTGGSYEYSAADLAAFPFESNRLQAHYATVARRIGIVGERDDLEAFSPFTASYQVPLALDPHSALLAARYRTHRDALASGGFALGRSRVAMLTQALGDREGCTELGRCLWGCPRQALYAPSATLRDCQRHPGFRYRPGLLARHFETDADGTIRSLVLEPVEGGEPVRLEADRYVLAAGAIGSSKIYLDSIVARGHEPPRLTGLLDNRMAMVPFLTFSMLGRATDLAAYQFHQLAFGIRAERSDEHAHGQITTLKAASIHPIIQSLPLDIRSALAVFRRIRSGLGVATLWVHARRDDSNYLTVEPEGERTGLRIRYRESEAQRTHLAWALGRLRRSLGRLGAIVPRSMTKILGPGASIHYGGTLPMTAAGGPHTLTPEGRSRLFGNLLVADAAGFPFLSAKNHTFTLMANAIRIAEAGLS